MAEEVCIIFPMARGLKPNKVPHVNNNSTPFSVSMLNFSEIIHLLLEEMNWYYHHYLRQTA
jgi:hypothetical protein